MKWNHAKKTDTRLLLALAFTSLVLAPFALAGVSPRETPIDRMGKELLSLRAEVEEAGRALEDERKLRQAEIDVLLQRKSELELGLKKEEMRTLQLQGKESALQEKGSATLGSPTRDSLDLLKWASALEESIRNSIPFSKEERLDRVGGLKKRIQDPAENPSTLITELWSATDQELKMARENEYRIGKIRLEGKDTPAEIARIGRVQMLFVTAEGVAGKAIRGNEGWALSPAATQNEAQAIQRTVSHFKNKKKSGWYEVPNP